MLVVVSSVMVEVGVAALAGERSVTAVPVMEEAHIVVDNTATEEKETSGDSGGRKGSTGGFGDVSSGGDFCLPLLFDFLLCTFFFAMFEDTLIDFFDLFPEASPGNASPSEQGHSQRMQRQRHCDDKSHNTERL